MEKKTLPCNVKIQVAAVVSKQSNLLEKKKKQHADTMPPASSEVSLKTFSLKVTVNTISYFKISEGKALW